MSIVIGFSGGSGITPRSGLTDALFPGQSFPKFDRLLVLQWAPSALMRGTLKPLPKTEEAALRSVYTVRGGAENTGRWWSEAVDIASLYQKAWPSDQISASRVTFIGIASTETDIQTTAFVSDLRLSR